MASQSQIDLNRKLRLEAQLRPKLRKFQNKVVRDFRAVMRRTGSPPNANEFNQELEGILKPHYQKVGNLFGNDMGPKLPSDVKKTNSEKAAIAGALTAWYLTVVPESAERINSTTRANMSDSVSEAEQDPLVRQQSGREALLTLASLAALLLARRLRARETSIIMTETQKPAETAKSTEAEVLSGAPASVIQPTQHDLPVTKEWVTRGDSLVRSAHSAADGQIVPINKPYEVGGDSLMYPGDPNLGAALGNIINCRCRSEYDKSEIVILRRAA